MTIPVLVTRTRPGVYKTAEKIEAMGFSPIIAPLLEIKYLNTAKIPSDHNVIIFSSTNGVRAFANLTSDRGSRVFCIGATTQDTAIEEGWEVVASSDGGTAEFVGLLKKHVGLREGMIIHPTNAETAYGVTKSLQQHGYHAEMVHCYSSKHVREWPTEASLALKMERSVIMFYSAEATVAYLGLSSASEYKERRMIGLSENVVMGLRSRGFKNIWVARKPTDDAMLNVLTLPDFIE